MYHTRLGFTKHFSGIGKRLETCFVKTIRWASKQETTISNPLSLLLRPYYCSLSLLELPSLVRSMTSHSLLEVTPSSFLPSPSSVLVGGHPHEFSCQMQNPLRNSHAFKPTPALISGDDSTLELTVSAIELGFVVDDALIEISILHNIGFKTPVICVLDCIKEGSIARGQPLKGLVEPMG